MLDLALVLFRDAAQRVSLDHGMVHAIDRQDDQLLTGPEQVGILCQAAVCPHHRLWLKGKLDGDLAYMVTWLDHVGDDLAP